MSGAQGKPIKELAVPATPHTKGYRPKPTPDPVIEKFPDVGEDVGHFRSLYGKVFKNSNEETPAKYLPLRPSRMKHRGYVGGESGKGQSQ